jgi:hypothetical protein
MRLLVVVAAAVSAALLSAVSVVPASAESACGRSGYSYAGLQAIRPAHGVKAQVVAVRNPYVENGHVAAWVGVGGAGQGKSGTDAWVQVGLSAFNGSAGALYYEINRPGVGPRYTRVLSDVPEGSRHRIAVLEVYRRPGWWRVWVDGRPVSDPVFLPGSHKRWHPIATAETWDGGRPVCNLFMYRFDRLKVAGPGGAWRRFVRGHRFQDPGYRVVGAKRGFLAEGVRPLPGPAVAAAPEPVPPAEPTETPVPEAPGENPPTEQS